MNRYIELGSFLLALCYRSWAYKGYATYYGGVGVNTPYGVGSCHQKYLPPGHIGIAISDSTFQDGWICGACLRGCLYVDGGQRCFEGVIDNQCGTCPGPYDLDLGTNGTGRYDVDWSFKDCPDKEPILTVGENATPYWARILIEGVGPVNSVEVNDRVAVRATGGGWSISDGSGSLGCGPKVKMFLADGRVLTRCMNGYDFGGGCPANGPRCYRRYLEGVDPDSEDLISMETDEQHRKLQKVHAYYVSSPAELVHGIDGVDKKQQAEVDPSGDEFLN